MWRRVFIIDCIPAEKNDINVWYEEHIILMHDIWFTW